MSDAADGAPEPRDNPHLVGHAAAETAFLEAWNAGRLAHAWLLSGPRGIGKATLAYRMARFVLAQAATPAGPDLFGAPPPPRTLQMSPADAVFRKISAMGHPDFRVAEREWTAKGDKRASVIKVEQIRDIISFIHLTPAESAWRVVLVDGADEMNEESANAILKILEEPPKRSILFLVAHNADRLLPTIRSRCRRMELRPLTADHVSTLIGRYRPDITAPEAKALSVLSDGSIGRAIDLADEGGVDLFAEFIGLMAATPEPAIADVHGFAEKAAKGDSFRLFAELASWWLSRLGVHIARGRKTPWIDIVPGEGAAALRLGRDPSQIADLCQDLVAFARRVDGVNVDKKRAAIGMLGRISGLSKILTV